MMPGLTHIPRWVPYPLRHRCVRTSLLLLACCFTLGPHPALAESEKSIIGIVYDSLSGAPVAEALVRLAGTTFWARSDPAGQFELLSIPAGPWRLRVERYGYRQSTAQLVDVVEGFERHVRVSLAPDPFILAPSVVRSQADDLAASTGVRRYSQEQIRQAGHRTLPEALEAIPGVRVYGSSETPGGTRVSVGGASPERVAILLDGLPLANGSDGAVDLDVLPLAAVKSIEVSPGSQSAGSGDAAIGGSVNLRTSSDSPHTHQELDLLGGSFATYRGTLSSGFRLGEQSLESVVEATRRGDQFTYPDGDSSAVRHGVGVQAWRGFLNIVPAGSNSVHASGFIYQSKAGAPGALEQLYPGAINRNTRRRAQGSWDFLRAGSLTVGSAFWFELGDDRLRSTRPIKNDTESLERFFGARLSSDLTVPSGSGRIEFGIRTRRLEGKDYVRPSQAFGTHDRLEFAVRSAAKKVVTVRRSSLSLTLTGAIDGDDRDAPVYSPRVDVGFWNLAGLHARAGWGRSFRRPPLTSLFWKADAFAVGNPQLRPEHASEWDAAVGMQRTAFSLESRYFERHIQDIISWERDAMGKYKPANVPRAFIFGREDQASLSFFGDRLTFAYTHIFNGAYDQTGELNHDGMVLVMSPRHTHDLSVNATSGRFSGRFSGRWVSSRELRRDNNSGKQLPPYRLFDGFARLAVRRASPPLRLGIRVDNITNERVDLLERFPAPGRTWYIETIISL